MSYIQSRKRAVLRADLGAAALSTAAMAALVALPAHAQSTDTASRRLKDVVVSAESEKDTGYKADVSASPKATAALLDTPQTITVIREQLVREQAATSLTEALQNSPGVGTFYLGENGNTSTGDAVFLRGTDVSGSIFVDGVRDVGSVTRDVFNTEQIEVLKGAAGSDIGRGAATGAISIATKQAKLGDFQSYSAGAGSKYYRATADVNFQVEDDLAIRLNAMFQDAGVAGRDRVQNDRWGVAASVGYGLNGPTRFWLNYQHVTQDNVPDGGVITIGLPGYSSPQTTRPFITGAPAVDSTNWYGKDQDYDQSRTNSVGLTVEHDFGSGWTLRNATRFSDVHQDYILSSFMAAAAGLLTPSQTDLSTWTMTRSANSKNADNTVLSNQTNLRGSFKTGAFNHTIATGVEFISELQKARTVAALGTLTPISIYNPSSAVPGYSTYLSGAYVKGHTKTAAIYLNDTIEFTPNLQLSAGLRVDHYDTEYTSVAVTGVPTQFDAKDTLLSGKVGVVYKPASNGSIYASYAITKQPPGGANFSLSATGTANANNPDVEPQVAKSYEAGTKWDLLDSRLSLTGAIYRTKYSDQILLDTDGAYYRAGAKRVQGIELQAIGLITDNWSINAGYTIMDTKVSSPTGLVVTADGSTVLAYNPKDSFTIWSTYKVGDLTVGGGARYNGKMKRGSDGAIGTPAFTESYWVFNATASYAVTEKLNLQLNVYNLFDKDYVAAINKSGYRYTPGVSRSARLTVNYAF